MTDRSTLALRLSQWLAEFESLAAAPDKLPAFIAGRLVENGIIQVEEDLNIVRAVFGGSTKLVRLTGWDADRRMLSYANVTGVGMGLLPISAVHPGDQQKLYDIMGRFGANPGSVPKREMGEWQQGTVKLSDLQGTD